MPDRLGYHAAMTVAGISQPERLDLARAEIDYWPTAVESGLADDWLARLLQEVQFEPEWLTLFGRRVAVPRRVAWYGDPGIEYTYSGCRHRPLPWTGVLLEIRRWLQELTGHEFNSVLGNLYRDGNDAMGWHADDEPSLGPQPIIASLSVGATRRFGLRSRCKPRVFRRLALAHGSLLLMGGDTQSHWQHCIYRSRRESRPRINLTFRQVLASDVATGGSRYTMPRPEGAP